MCWLYPTKQGVGTEEVSDDNSTDAEHASGGLSQKVMAFNISCADKSKEFSRDSEDSDDTSE